MASNGQSNDSVTGGRVEPSAISIRIAEARRQAGLTQIQGSSSASANFRPAANDRASAAGRALIPLRGLPRESTRSTILTSSSRPSMAVAIIPPPLRPTSSSTASTTSSLVIVPPLRSSTVSTVSATSAASSLDKFPSPIRSSSASATPTSTTSSDQIHPSEQRRLKLIESRNMDRIDKRMALESRLSPSSAEVDLRMAALRNQTNRAYSTASEKKPAAAGHFAKTCATDLLFLIDTTHSMSPYIKAAKNQVTSIVKELSAAFLHKATLRVGVVGYKDHGDDPHIQLLDFTPNVDRVVSFLGKLSARGGADVPEDVLGALQVALRASWKNETRCIIHITDAPAHGHPLHDFEDDHDYYFEPGSEPHGLTHSSILQAMISKNINYTLLRITEYTDRMAYVFHQAYPASSPDCSLLDSNTYAKSPGINARSSKDAFQGWSTHAPGSGRRPRFCELELGSSYHALRTLVVQSVTSSVTSSGTFNPSSRVGPKPDAGRGGKLGRSSLATEVWPSSSSTITAQSASSLLSVALDTEPPQWDTPGWLNEEIKFEAYSAEMLAHNDGSVLNHMMDNCANINVQTTNLSVSMRSKPFAKGASRLASFARSGASRAKLVVKTYMDKEKTLPHLIDDMCAQALCKAFALEFNAMLPEKYSLDFIVVTCLERAPGTARDGDKRLMSLEPWIQGEYVKYNSNQGWVNNSKPDDPIFQAAQAFSHFTFERTEGNFMVTDLQGVGRVLTDPALQKLDPSYLPLSEANLGADGFYWFFSTHTCNAVCKQLRLQSTREMFISGDYQFRERWATRREAGNMLVCCSNKLCSRIVSMADAKTSDDFPGYRWCHSCWSELQSSMETVVCTAPGYRLHQFDRARFFYESQGQVLPRRCPKHSLDDEAGDAASASTTATSTRSIADLASVCRFGGECTNMECRYIHPKPACPNAKTCEDVDCSYRHPIKDCRFKNRCLNPVCLFRHPGGHPAGPISRDSCSSPAPDCKYGAACTNTGCVYRHPVELCEEGGDCDYELCSKRHPRKAIMCRHGGNCLNPKCVYEHPSRL